MPEARRMGVEEEFLLVDPESGEPRPAADEALRADERRPEPAAVEAEMLRQQIETSTEPCRDPAELLRELRRSRHDAAKRARAAGVDIVALATSPLATTTTMTGSERYRRIQRRFGVLAEQQLSCGFHVHVELGDGDDEGGWPSAEAVAVLDRVRPWLAPLLAMSANSPFWRGEDSGYASFRHQVWSRWPSAGPTELFGSAEAYRRTVEAIVGTRTVVDEGQVYFYARAARAFPTVEVRVSDVCLDTRDTTLLAVLARAIVDTAADQWRAGESPDPVRTDLLRLASWQASRHGLGADLLHPRTMRPVPAGDVLDAVLAHAGPALARAGDEDLARAGVGRLLRDGTGADTQRAIRAEAGSVAAVVDQARRLTLDEVAL